MSSEQIIRQGVVKQLIVPQTATTTVTGVGIDRKGFDNATIIVSIGATLTTTETLSIAIQESDTVGGTYVAITGAVFPNFTGTDDNKTAIGAIDLKKRKAFIRAVGTIAGTTPSFALSVEALLSNAPASIADATHGATPAGLRFNV